MIAFFEPKPNTDIQCFNGSYPYVHWAGPFSTGVIRYLSLHFVSDKPSIYAYIENWGDDWNFALYRDPEHIDTEYDDIDWYNLDNVAVKSLGLTGQLIGGKYIYQLIVICRADVEGEFLEDIYIDNAPYKIGAEFQGENESLQINLANQGTELPELVTKAIYSSDVYEDDTDWVLLNRKLRELITCHMELLDNKGSYKSLENTLQWFEYKDLVELREVWKYETPDGTKMYDQPINKFVSDAAKVQMFNSAKTTYFTLRSLKKTWASQTAPDPNDELVPTIYDAELDTEDPTEQLACMWSEEEMRLKMVLLGNFFETYFMPIHTELVRSVVEDISAHKIYIGYSKSETVIEECFSEANDFDVDFSSDQEDPQSPSDLSEKTYHLDIVHVSAGLPRTSPYSNALENDGTVLLSQDAYKGLEYAPIIACHMVDEDDEDTVDIEDAFTKSLGQFYNGIGALVTGKFSFEEPIVAGSVECNQWGEYVTTSFAEDNPSNEFSLTFLFPYAGSFIMSFRFKGESGKYYTKLCKFTIKDNLRVDLKYYALVAAVDRTKQTPNPFTASPELLYNTTRTLETHASFNETELAYEAFLEDIEHSSYEDSTRYITYIPAFNTTSQNWRRPYTTKMRTIQFLSNMSVQLVKFKTRNRAELNNYWIDMHTDVDEDGNSLDSGWVRMVPKYRDQPIKITAKAYDEDGNLIASDAYREFDRNVFFPELHKLVPINGKVSNEYPIVCQPTAILELSENGEQVEKHVPFSYISSQSAWEFYSYALVKNISELSDSICDPFISWPYKEPLPNGYYKVTFRYRIGDDEKTIIDNPSWKIVDTELPEFNYEQYKP